MGKKGKIAAILAAIGAAIAGIFFSKKENREKAKKTFEDAKSKTISATNKAKESAKKAKQRVEQELSLTDIKGVGKVRAKRLRENGIVTVAQVRRASISSLAKKGDMSENQAKKIQNSAKGMK